MMRSRLSSSLAALALLTLLSSRAEAAVVNVSSVKEIKDAVAAATPGTVIEVAPGDYAFTAALWSSRNGEQDKPIVLRAATTGSVRFDFSQTEEGLVIAHTDWTVEHLWINGACSGGGCGDGAAGIHVKATGSRVVIRQSRITNWAESIKTDRSPTSEPTDGLIVGNEISNDAAGFTQGGTGVDIVGGLRWHIIGNYVHDYARNDTHYGIFVKGGAKDAVIERNLVIGAKTLPKAGTAVGISFGGGGTGTQFCASDNVGGGGCACETFDGIARNNIVLRTTDAGLHTKRACGSVFANNTVYDTGLGLQVQIVGAGAPVEIRNSVLGKGVSSTATASNNLLNVSDADWKKLYVDPEAVDFREGTDASAIRGKGAALANVTDDYFGAARAATPTLGAIELPTTGVVWPWSEPSAPSGTGTGDGGASSSSGGDAPGTGAPPADGSSSSSSGASGEPAPGAEPDSDGGGCSAARGRHGAGLAALGALAAVAFAAGARRRRRENRGERVR